MVKVAQKRESSRIQIEDLRCDTVQAKSVEIHGTCILPRVCVCGSMSNVDRTRTHVSSSEVAAAEQQPEGWRFVTDTILPGCQWAPQWVPARTPTVHWGPISGKAVGGPNHSSAQQYSAETRQTFFFCFFFVPLFLCFFFFSFFLKNAFLFLFKMRCFLIFVFCRFFLPLFSAFFVLHFC